MRIFCDLCGKEFFSEREIIDHIDTHTLESLKKYTSEQDDDF